VCSQPLSEWNAADVEAIVPRANLDAVDEVYTCDRHHFFYLGLSLSAYEAHIKRVNMDVQDGLKKQIETDNEFDLKS
jgi:hypothetical protein